jgi:hypothetical protein
MGSIAAMGYKILGYVVWQGGKWYVRRRYPDAPRKLAMGGVAALLLAVGAAVFAVRQNGADGS